MSTLLKLDALLSKEHHFDYWSDIVIGDAINLINKLTENEWLSLVNICFSRSSVWQKQFADAASSTNKFDSSKVIEKMLTSEDLEVALEAASCLECLEQWKPSKSQISTLRSLLKQSQENDLEIYEGTLNELLHRSK